MHATRTLPSWNALSSSHCCVSWADHSFVGALKLDCWAAFYNLVYVFVKAFPTFWSKRRQLDVERFWLLQTVKKAHTTNKVKAALISFLVDTHATNYFEVGSRCFSSCWFHFFIINFPTVTRQLTAGPRVTTVLDDYFSQRLKSWTKAAMQPTFFAWNR